MPSMPSMPSMPKTVRLVVAACIAPAIPASIVLAWRLAKGDDLAWWAASFFLLPSYLAMLFVGVPLLILMRRKDVGFSVARCTAAGALGGAAITLPVAAIDLIHGGFQDHKIVFAIIITVTGLIAGMVAGFFFWIIISLMNWVARARTARSEDAGRSR